MQETTSQNASTTLSDASQGGARSLDMILDIPMQVTVELGRTKMAIKELLQLSQGSIIELNKMAGDHLEVFVNNKLIARGEVVVVNDRFGIRISEILSPQERVERMG
jgi:flagellar motor switch protein FliN/FliY